MKDHSQKLSFVVSILFLIVSSGVFLFLYTEIDNNKKTSEQSIGQWQAEAQRRGQTESLIKSLKMVDGERAMLETHFAQSTDVVPFLDKIDSLAVLAKTKTEVSSVDISKDNSGLLVGVTATGTFEAVYKYLLLLENSPYEVSFVSADMERDSVDPLLKVAKPDWTATFKIKLISFVP